MMGLFGALAKIRLLLQALNLRGTYREHERKPYCHECFYRLYNGLIYAPDEKQAKIEKLI